MERAMWSPTSAILMLGVFFLSFGLIAPQARAIENNVNNNAKVQTLLNQANYQANRLNKDTNTMVGLVHSQVGWQGRAFDLMRVRNHVNKLGKLMHKLQASRDEASAWQKQSIDHVVPLLRLLAVNTTDEINYVNANHNFPYSPQYTKLANQSAEMAQKLSGKISDIVRYNQDKGQLDSLSRALDLSGSTANG